MRIDEAGDARGQNNACLTEPFSQRRGSDEDGGKG